jgi:hypothetical protein
MWRALFAIVVAVPMAGAAPAQPALSVKDVMRRVAAYVDAYGEKAQIVVATEHYTQDLRGNVSVPETRRILAEFAIVKVPRLGWQGFRDVVEVDGARISDRDDRLVRILTASGGGFDEARRLSNESARFNIGALHRNFNVPTTALFFFSAENLDRFRFAARGVQPDGTWEIAFRETSRPTLIRTPDGQSVPSEGSIWVNPSDGTVVRTLLKLGGFAPGGRTKGTAHADVRYRHVTDLGMWLPASMDEQFETNGMISQTISGRALYSNYRQFTTSGRIK